MEVHVINYLKIAMIYIAMNFVVNNLVNKIAICLLHDDPQIWGQKINFAICKFVVVRKQILHFVYLVKTRCEFKQCKQIQPSFPQEIFVTSVGDLKLNSKHRQQFKVPLMENVSKYLLIKTT